MKSKNFTQLNELIGSNSKEIVLDCDFALDSDEDFRDGIRIERDVIIDGKGHIIDARERGRIFDISGANVTFKNIIFKNGHSQGDGGAIISKWALNVIDCEFIGCVAEGLYGGSAIYNWDGFLVVNECMFSYNLALGDYSGGGAISNSGKAIIIDSKFLENKSIGDYGGGAIVNAKIMKVTGSEFIKNHAEYAGGAISNDKGELTVKDCEFIGNSGSNGGAIHSKNSNVDVSGCRFRGNSPNDVR
jgi:predicted outer membrane repeat protein